LDFKGIIFDLDMTLVDTSSLLTMRDQRLWNQVYQNISKTKIYDGVLNLLDQLKDGVKAGIVTSSPRTYAERVIDYHGLNIQLLTAYHDTQKHKPHADPILDGISKLGLKPYEVISIGDEEKDIIASNNAGAKSVLVKWGNSGNNNYAANYHCESVDELKRILFES